MTARSQTNGDELSPKMRRDLKRLHRQMDADESGGRCRPPVRRLMNLRPASLPTSVLAAATTAHNVRRTHGSEGRRAERGYDQARLRIVRKPDGIGFGLVDRREQRKRSRAFETSND